MRTEVGRRGTTERTSDINKYSQKGGFKDDLKRNVKRSRSFFPTDSPGHYKSGKRFNTDESKSLQETCR